ncbi:MAG: SPOR domain-containing protein [Bacteroidales bacterium]|nr:SPOR domain-containing protein [Lentimicrobiaceae bacterium]MDD5694103.1 SPOR domain-containing protein [Bacteroidales bacterium]
MRYSIVILFLYVMVLGPSVQVAKAQQEPAKEGHLEIVQDNRVNELLQKHVALNRSNQTLDGYRIQIFFDAGNYSRSNAYRVRDEFLSRTPDSTIAVYVSFNEPYYRVRAGDFRTRMEAEGFLKRIKPDFPNAFLIRDQINLPKID